MPLRIGSDQAEAIRELKQSRDEHSRILRKMWDHFDERFDTFGERFDTLERRFKTLDAKIDSVLNRLPPLP